jgi:hypothetical protein
VSRAVRKDRQITGGSELPRQVKPVAGRKQHVEHGEIRRGGQDQVRVRVVGEAGDGDPFPPERAFDRVAYRLLVLDEHHPWRVRAHEMKYPRPPER